MGNVEKLKGDDGDLKGIISLNKKNSLLIIARALCFRRNEFGYK